MAKKYDLISELYDRTGKMVTDNPAAWQAFLRSACYNFRLRFDEQLLVFAQRPDATAVLEIERWNETFNRWVNKGAKGIAVFEDADRSKQRLKHYFDISDTHENRFSRPVPIWQMKPEYEGEVIETLESTFGELQYKGSIEEAIVCAAENAVEDNLPDYLPDLIASKAGSFMEELNDDAVAVEYRQLVTDSVAYMIMARLGMEPMDYFGKEDFTELYNFNTPETLNALGIATSDIAEMALSEIAKTVISLERQNRIIAATRTPQYNGGAINQERSTSHGNQLHEAGGLPSAQPEDAGAAGGDAGQVRSDEAQVSEGDAPDSVLQSADQGQTDRASGRGGTEGAEHGGDPGAPDGADRGSNREAESGGHDELGPEDEQSEELGTGDRESGSGLRLSGHDFNAPSDYGHFHQDAEKNELLLTSSALKSYRKEIAAYFTSVEDRSARGGYLKTFFDGEPREMILSNGQKVGYQAYDDVLHLWRGSYADRESEVFMRWNHVADSVYGMMLLHQWLESDEVPLPSFDEQMSLIEKAESEKTSAFSLPQEAIDYVLCGGSGVSEGKMRIYRQFRQSLSATENIAFLKSEYGTGGHSDAIPGSGLWEDHDGKGIAISNYHTHEKLLLPWNKVEKRISELINLDRYLNPKEADAYPAWLAKEEERRREAEERREVREALSTAPTEKEKVQEAPANYEYHLGDKVYLGAQEYEILSFDESRVMLYDVEYPLFNKEMPRVEFDEKVRENPLNDHLKAKDAPKEAGIITLHRVGDFYEMFGDEAEAAAEVLGLALTSREINGERIPMCGIPFHLRDRYAERLELAGYTVPIMEDSNIIRTLRGEQIEEKDDDTPIPVGRIDFLGNNGKVGESIEYRSEAEFLSAIREENHVGAPMSIVLYRSGNGETISTAFLQELDPPPNGFSIEDYSPERNNLLDEAKKLIEDFVMAEYGEETAPDFGDLTKIGIAYTTLTDDEIPIQVNVDLVNFSISWYVDDRLYDTRKYETMDELIENELVNLEFDALVAISDEGIEAFMAEAKEIEAEKAKPNLTPAWEKKKAKVPTFDLHPDVPMAERHTFDLASHPVEEVNKKERFHRNYAAIKVLKDCQRENRFATPEEQIVLSRYVGWGGIQEAFMDSADSWKNEYAMLKEILTPEEYASARESTLTAFYTPPAVIAAIYKAMEQMGFKDGNILEPSCGIGNFMGMLPDSMKDAKMYGVELDKVSAGIAQQLYQKTTIAAQPFEQADIPDSFFDAVVGNVPFGDFSLADKRYDKYHFLIHDYFFAKSLDKLRPGGIMALVTSKGTMDKANSNVRKYIAQRADLLGAIRLPNNTFKGNAGTEVVSDILILQKRDRMIDLEPDWVHLGTDENGMTMNSYFVQHPEMVLGESKMVSGRFGEELTVVPYEGADLSAQLDEAIANIHGEITEYEMDDELTEEDDSIPADPSVRNFSYAVLDDKIYYRENSRMAPVTVSATAENRIKGMIQIRDCARLLLEMQTEDYPEENIQKQQQELNRLYDTFTAKYGLISSRANASAFSQDSSFSLLSALEILDEDGNLERKADIFTKRTIKPHVPVTSVDTASEALAVSMGERAFIDMEYMSSLCGKSEKEIYEELKGVIFLNPQHSDLMGAPKYLMADEYLSGNVREKLRIAKASNDLYQGDYQANVEALEKVQPKDLTASEIYVRLGATWLPVDDVQDFMTELLETPYYMRYRMQVHYSPYTSEWNIENKTYDRNNVKANTTYGTKRVSAYKIIEETLNLKDVRVFDYIEDENGNKKAVLNAKETAIAQAKQELIKQAFQDWVWKDPDRRERLVTLYNEKFNSIRPREYDGSHITFSGMNPEIELREHQKNAVAHVLYGGNTLLAHAVGAGKTYEMAAAAMESKRLGLCSKSLFVVPNHLTEQWAAEFLQLYPGANILVATKKDFETKNRKKFCGRIATGDYDAVIIGHSQFEKIPMSVERQIAILEQERDEILKGIQELKWNRGEKFTIKQLEKSKKSIEAKLKKLNDQSRKDDVVTFEELGVDRLFIDESHYYKNLYLYTKMRNVGGIAQTEAQKSSDLYMKTRYLDEITGGRGTVFATGTPISNSMVELYTIQRYLQYNTLVEHGLQHFDAWASSFGETVTAVELKPEGTGYRTKTRFSRFFNLPELMSMFKEVADIQTADMLNLPVPKVNFHNIAVKPSEVQKAMVADLAERAEKVRSGGVNPSVDNMLRITNDGRKLALDQRMIDPKLPDFEGSKLNACVEEMFKVWENGKEKRSTQLFFCDLSTPKTDGSFSVYNDIRDKLIARGVPESEIKFIHDADTETKKADLFKKVRKGEVRVLMGSTQKMGAGTNVQDKLLASTDLDCPWRPSDLEQRLGRIVRQGNENPEVDVFRYVTEGTFDAYLYQLIEGKQKFVSQIMTSKSPVRSAEDIDETALSYAEIKMLATGNPHIKEKMDLDNQVSKLKLLKSNYLSEKYALEDKILKYFPKEIARLTESVAAFEQDVATAEAHPKPEEGFVGIQIRGATYTEKLDAGQAIIDACKAQTTPDAVPLGHYRGFDLLLQFNTMERTYEVKIKGHGSVTVSLGDDILGNITRIDNGVDRFATYLESDKRALSETQNQLEIAKVEVEKPFAREDELKEKTARLDELNILLNLDKRENEFADDAPEESDMEPERKAAGLER